MTHSCSEANFRTQCLIVTYTREKSGAAVVRHENAEKCSICAWLGLRLGIVALLSFLVDFSHVVH